MRARCTHPASVTLFPASASLKDLLQLISDETQVKLLKQKDYIRYNHKNFVEDWGFEPIRMIDYKALAGDPSDNIPGVKGIGDKTAINLLTQYETIEDIYEHIDEIKGKMQEKLINDKESAFISKEIATIYREAFTRGPGLMGSLLVGVSFAKGLARSLNIPMIDVNHLQAHVLAHFVKESEEDTDQPKFPFLCLLVSGGNSQIILVKAYNDMEVIGQTIDDAAGEAIDKCSKVMGFGYPGGPIIDRLARQGNPKAFTFSKPHIPEYN